MSRFGGFLVVASIALCTSVDCSWSPALGGTTGEIQGFVTDVVLQPLSGVSVAAVAPSGRALASTDSNGFYSFNGLPPDSYTVTFSKDGYLTQTMSGVTSIQDQFVFVDVRLRSGIKTLAHVNVRSPASLVQPTVTADTYVVSESRLEGINGTPQDLNGLTAFSSLPGVTTDNSGMPTIRAGEQNDVEYVYDGVDNTDPIAGGVINSFSLNGTQSFQLSTGGYDVSNGNTNSGVINQVIKRGSYPPSGQATIRLTDPTFGHELAFDYGNASPNGRFSYFVGFGGQNDAVAFGDRTTVLSLQLNNSAFTTVDDDVVNLFYHFGQGDKNEVQLLSNLSGGTTTFGYLIDPAFAPYASNNGDVQASSDPFGLGPQSPGHPSTFQSDYISLFPGQAAYRQNTNAADTFTYNSVIDKLNFKRQLTSSSFVEARVYRAGENFVASRPYDLG
jgi:hypothetical protein